MRKVTSFLIMAVLYCSGAFAQATEYADKLIRIGKAQAEMVPNTWYFLHQTRNEGSVDRLDAFAMPGDYITTEGGLATDMGPGQPVKMSTKATLEKLAGEDGADANSHMGSLVRFVPVEGVEGAYNIQFGTGNWIKDVPEDGTVNKIGYLGGLAGRFNFYLVTMDGKPNQAGRFAWNLYNMQDRMDQFGSGGNLTYWLTGERVATEDEIENDPLGGGIQDSRIWQIYDVEITGDIDLWMVEFETLIEEMNNADITWIEELRNGTNVGTGYGNYLPADVEAFLHAYDTLSEAILIADTESIEAFRELYPTIESLQALRDSYTKALQVMTDNRVPIAVTDLKPGYYTINSAQQYFINRKDTIFYTQHEADSINQADGNVPDSKDWVTTDSLKEVTVTKVNTPVKGMYCAPDQDGKYYGWWNDTKPLGEFLWKLETVDGQPTRYRLTNAGTRLTFNGIDGTVEMFDNDTATVCFDFVEEGLAPVTGDKVTFYAIRNSHQPQGGYKYLACDGHKSGAGEKGKLTAWNNAERACQWFISRIDEETAQEWLNGDEARLAKLIGTGDSIAAAAPAQMETAKDIHTTVYEDEPVVTDATQFYGNSFDADGRDVTEEETLGFLIDGDVNTYWVTSWHDGQQPKHAYYLEITADQELEGDYLVKLSRRNTSNDHPVKLAVRGYAGHDESLAFEDGMDLGVITFPFNGAATTEISNELFDAKGCKAFRFYWEESNGSLQNGWWQASEFNMFRAETGTRYETTQYAVRKEIADRLAAAIEAWQEAGYSSKNTGLLTDPGFLAAYDAIVAAGKAWKDVFVDPAALRAAIASVPAKELFAIGTDPGQWKDLSTLPQATVDKAQAYDEAGAYTPAESEAHIRAVNEAVERAFASANRVETGKWYRLKFPQEQAYEDFGWSKEPAAAIVNRAADVQLSPSLFGKTIAPGVLERTFETFDNTEAERVDTLDIRTIALAEELTDGSLLFYHDAETEFSQGEDLFRFIQATDTSYMIQNKATGLFLRAGFSGSTLSAVPSYFSQHAIGAGANLLSYTNVLGDTPGRHDNLCGQLSQNLLVTWQDDALGTNSMIIIEEAGDVTEEPATEYVRKLWPGQFQALTMPVDITIAPDAGATAYGAELVVSEADTVIVLKNIEAQVIKAGTPYILIADPGEEYVSPDDVLKQIAQDLMQATGQYGIQEQYEAGLELNSYYVDVTLDHGMAVDTLQKGNGHLTGTLRSEEVKAGKGILVNGNGFRHALVDTYTDEYGAYIACDFDAETEDVLCGIIVEFNGSIETGIGTVLDKVARPGNIYTVDGKLAGKGNINTVNHLPAGVYIVNGVKVIRK